MKKIIISALTIILFHPLILSSAETYDALRKLLINSLGIKTDKERLSAYDTIAKKVKTESESKNKAAVPENWTMSVNIDPIDDSKQLIFSCNAQENIESYSKPLLVLRYSKGVSEAFISWSRTLDYTEDENVEVTLRFDKEEAVSGTWNLSSSRDGSFSPEPVDLITKILSHKSLTARTSGVTTTLTTQFDLTGLKQLVEKHEQELHWITPVVEKDESESENESSDTNTDDEK